MSSTHHRPRIRRRAANNKGGSAAVATAAAMALSLVSLPASAQASYLGPTHCVKPGTSAAAALQHVSGKATTKGYSTFNHLLFDMVSLANTFKSGQPIPDKWLTFKICPGTVIDLDDSSLPLGFLPVEVPRLTLQCGERGRRGSGPTDSCIIRGGGKRDPGSGQWNSRPQHAYKNSASGILGGGLDSVAQVYVYGESAYEVTLRGLTFDNSPTKREVDMYREYVTEFGAEGFNDDDDSGERSKEKIEKDYDESVPSSSSNSNTWGEADQLEPDQGNLRRDLQDPNNDGSVHPARRFASVAMRGKGYGDDAGPRLITIENCRFEHHRGYAVLVSPGIQEPNMPVVPEFEFPKPPSSQSPLGGGNDDEGNLPPVNLQSSGQIYAHSGVNASSTNSNGNSETLPNDGNNRRKQRELNLLDSGGKYIPQDGLVSYYDNAAGKNYHDGRRVKIFKTEFISNIVAGDNVAGLVTSAYSLTIMDCFFQKNDAKSMVFVYNNDALVDNTIFVENTVEVSTVVMASPKGSKPLNSAVTKNGDVSPIHLPTHIVERSCFMGSHVGMSNVLVTDVEAAGFGQRDNHATGTDFTWVSNCEGGAAEQLGEDCMEKGMCDGTCIRFTSEQCLADRVNSREYAMLFNGAGGGVGGSFGSPWAWRTTLTLAFLLGAGFLI